MLGTANKDSRRDTSARAIARRNAEAGGKPLNTVMKTAATARELAHGEAAEARRRSH